MALTTPDLTAKLRIAAALAFLAIALLVSPARAAATQDLSGEWLNSAYTLSAFQLHMSGDGKTLSATWNANVGKLQEGLLGRFTGTLNESGTAFTGPIHVNVGSLSIGGTMTFTITSQQKFGYPLLAVSYQQDDGIVGSLTLEIWLVAPKASAGASQGPPVSLEFLCPGPRSCRDEAEAQAGSSASADKGIVGSVRFTLQPGHSRLIRLSLNETGRTLLAKRRSLRVRVVVLSLTKPLTLPPLTTLETVTLHTR